LDGEDDPMVQSGIISLDKGVESIDYAKIGIDIEVLRGGAGPEAACIVQH
jgi:hypothetical protein